MNEKKNGTCECDSCASSKSYYWAIIESPQFNAWRKVAHEHGFDVEESVEIGDIGEAHLQAFFKFIKDE